MYSEKVIDHFNISFPLGILKYIVYPELFTEYCFKKWIKILQEIVQENFKKFIRYHNLTRYSYRCNI